MPQLQPMPKYSWYLCTAGTSEQLVQLYSLCSTSSVVQLWPLCSWYLCTASPAVRPIPLYMQLVPLHRKSRCTAGTSSTKQVTLVQLVLLHCKSRCTAGTSTKQVQLYSWHFYTASPAVQLIPMQIIVIPAKLVSNYTTSANRRVVNNNTNY